MRPMTLRISSTLLVSIEETALASMPEECCGLLIGHVDGDDRRVQRTELCQNVSTLDRRNSFEVDPQRLFDAIRESPDTGDQILGFYHSHPDGSVRPSARDTRAAWPGKSYVIVGIESPRIVAVRSWLLSTDATSMDPEPIALTDGEHIY